MTVPGPTSSKNDLRAAALAARDGLSREHREAVARVIALRGLPIEVMRGAIVAGYSPIRSEIDPVPLMRHLSAQGAQLALPVIGARGQSLLLRRWSPEDPPLPGALGILEPLPPATELSPEVLLVPLAAFDRVGHRI